MAETDAPSEKILQQVIDTFWQTIPPIWHITRAYLHSQAVQHFDITVEQFHILRRIREGRATVSQLADAKHISRAATSRAVDALVNRGLVKRTPDGDDRRRVFLALSDKGQQLIDSMFDSSRSWMAEKFSQLNEDELQLVVQAMENLHLVFQTSGCQHASHHR